MEKLRQMLNENIEKYGIGSKKVKLIDARLQKLVVEEQIKMIEKGM